MKDLNFFEMRDKLLIDILQQEFELHYYEGILNQVSFEALANQNKFRESHAMAYLFKLFLQCENNQDLQVS